MGGQGRLADLGEVSNGEQRLWAGTPPEGAQAP